MGCGGKERYRSAIREGNPAMCTGKPGCSLILNVWRKVVNIQWHGKAVLYVIKGTFMSCVLFYSCLFEGGAQPKMREVVLNGHTKMGRQSCR